MTDLHPSPKHRFTFGLWPDSYGESSEPPVEPCDFVYGLSDIGGWGVSLQDDDVVAPDAPRQERAEILARFRAALDATGVVVSMVTTNLSQHPAFAGGSFTSADRDVRRYAVQQAIRGIDLGVGLGAELHSFRCGGEGVQPTAAKPIASALDRYREAIDFLCAYVRDQGYPTRFALEPSRDALLPTTGHVLAFIETLNDPELVGLSSSIGHEREAGPISYHGVAQALWSGKLFHIDLGAPLSGPWFGWNAIMGAFFEVKLLEESGYNGPRNFASWPAGIDADGAFVFAAGCMRTYLALAAKARRFAEDPDIQEALADVGALELAEPSIGLYSRESAQDLAGQVFDPDKLAARSYRATHLNQLVTDLLLGLR